MKVEEATFVCEGCGRKTPVRNKLGIYEDGWALLMLCGECWADSLRWAVKMAHAAQAAGVRPEFVDVSKESVNGPEAETSNT